MVCFNQTKEIMSAEDLLKKVKTLFEKEGLSCSPVCYDKNKLQNKTTFYIFGTVDIPDSDILGTYKKFSVTIEDFSVDSNGNSLLK